MGLQPSRRVSASAALVYPWIIDKATLQEAAEASIIYHWQADLQASPYQGTDGYFERPRSVSRQQNVPFSAVQHMSSDRPILPPPPNYIFNSPIVPVVPSAEYNPSYLPTVPIPHYLYPTVPPAEHNSIGHPTIRDRRRNKTAAIGDMEHHHSFQQDDTTPALENPYQEFYSGCRPPATA